MNSTTARRNEWTSDDMNGPLPHETSAVNDCLLPDANRKGQWRAGETTSETNRMHRLTLTLLALSLATAFAHAGDNWPRFRGDNGAGVADDVIPAKWTDADYAWKTELHGVGHSSPVVWGDKVFVTSADEEA